MRRLLTSPVLAFGLLFSFAGVRALDAQDKLPQPRVVDEKELPKKEPLKFPFFDPKKEELKKDSKEEKKDPQDKKDPKKEPKEEPKEEPKKEPKKEVETKKEDIKEEAKKEEPKKEESAKDPAWKEPLDKAAKAADDAQKAADKAATSASVADRKGDSAWMIVASALVMLMVPGLALFYAGMVRKKNVLATMMQSFAALAVVGVFWVAIGYSLAFGPSAIIAPDFLAGLFGDAAKGGGIIGFSSDLVFLKGVKVDDYLPGGTIPVYLHMLFQGMFAIITPALISGALAERIRFWPFCIFMILWVTCVYCPLAHMVWAFDWFAAVPEDITKGLGGSAIGLLGKMGALDFAGGTVVHIAAGMGGLACCLALRRRKGYPEQVVHPNSMVLTLLGAGLLWFGWFGFNGGSALNSTNLAVSAFGATQAAAAGAGLSWILVEWIFKGKPTALGLASGIVAGLVAVTPASGYVELWGGLLIGLIAGVVCYLSVQLKGLFGYDDSLDAFGVHAVGGFLGAVLTGFFCYASVQSGSADGFLAVKGIQPRIEYLEKEIPTLEKEIPDLYKPVAVIDKKIEPIQKIVDELTAAKAPVLDATKAVDKIKDSLIDTPGDAELKDQLKKAEEELATVEKAFESHDKDLTEKTGELETLTKEKAIPAFKHKAARDKLAAYTKEVSDLKAKVKTYADEKTSRTTMTQPLIQFKAALFSTVFALIISLVLALLTHILTGGNFTTSEEEESLGLDQTEHGEVGFDFGLAGESISISASTEPRAAKVPPGSKRFEIVVEGIENGGLIHAWNELCQPAQEGKPLDPDFKAIYPFVTTVQGNRFRFRGGDSKNLAAHVQRLFMKKLGKRDLKVRIEE